ncbi:lactate dehydrogenase [Clostridium sp.]|uniref:lactate/malate family dehydrogenase n=1 Tax=Clostridium sp. TaxID=1506 RepID=UPI003464A8F9
MNIYKYKNSLLICNKELNFEKATEEEAKSFSSLVYYLDSKPLDSFRSYFKINSLSDLEEESMNTFKKSTSKNPSYYPDVLKDAIDDNRGFFLNLANKDFKSLINPPKNHKFKINVVGLGDVGGTLLTGLRLLGGDIVKSIGIFDLDKNKVDRWVFECNQILDINNPEAPLIEAIEENDLFNCDMFVFCVSVGVPEVGKEHDDVRLVQFEGNKKVLSLYAKKAREAKFKGIFAVVSDPVDLLCKVAFNESNRNFQGEFDYNGLLSHQIRGYGLGVMNARANYFAMQNLSTKNYLNEGRAFGPHGEGLIIANSIENYSETLSNILTEDTKKANLQVRKAGFKPYIAPALSSGALSLLATLRGQWHYSATFVGGTFMGCKNRMVLSGTELETYDFPAPLFKKLENTYEYLNSLYK